MKKKCYKLFFAFHLFLLTLSGIAQDTINYVAPKSAASGYTLTATQGKQFTINWGNGDIQTYLGTGESQFVSYSYPVWPPEPNVFSVTITSSEPDCKFTQIAISGVIDFDASKASLEYINLNSATNYLKHINLSNCATLKELKCSFIGGSNLKNIDLSDCISLRSLKALGNPLSTLDVSNTVLECIDISYCNFLLSDIYPIYLKVLYPDCSYYTKQSIVTQTIYVGESVDFSSEKEFGGIATLFRVYIRQGEGMIPASESAYSINDGIITFHQSGTSYIVYMTADDAMPAYYSPGVFAPIIVREPVQEIINVPTTAIAGTPLTLTGTVVPNNATYKTIIWSVKDAGTTCASITGSKLYTTDTGTVIITATIKNGKGTGKDFTQDFSINVINVGINEQAQELSMLNIHPNPTSGELIVENGNLRVDKVEIHDIAGKIVLFYHFNFTSDNLRVDISHLTSGTYFVKIITEKGEITKKILKE